jgi:putative NADPH-quinone reductase
MLPRGPKKILIINGNPDPSPARLSSALAKAYREGAEQAGHHVHQIDIGGLNIPFLRTAAAFAAHPGEKAVVEAQAAFMAAEHAVFIYPLWLGGPPALLKAYMEQLACGHFLLREAKAGFPQGGLKGRSARVVVTMGMPPLIYRTVFGAHGVKAFNGSILRISGFTPVRTSYFGGAAIAAPRNGALIKRLRAMGGKAA